MWALTGNLVFARGAGKYGNTDDLVGSMSFSVSASHPLNVIYHKGKLSSQNPPISSLKTSFRNVMSLFKPWPKIFNFTNLHPWQHLGCIVHFAQNAKEI